LDGKNKHDIKWTRTETANGGKVNLISETVIILSVLMNTNLANNRMKQLYLWAEVVNLFVNL
jgi:hypothetical protein